MKAPKGRVTKPDLHKRRTQHLPQDLINKWNSSLFIGPRQPSILNFVSSANQTPNVSVCAIQQGQNSDQGEDLEELPESLSTSPKHNLATYLIANLEVKSLKQFK